MPWRNRLGVIVKKSMIGIVVLALAGAGLFLYFTRVASTPIGNILKDPRVYEGKELTIAGTVTDRTSLIVVKYFLLRDGTGEIMVVTDKTLPSVGSHLRVRGKAREAFSIGQEQLLVFVEGDGEGGENDQ
jgi:hypothetical protein